MKIQFRTAMTRGEKVCTGVLCGLATSLFIVPSALAEWADVSMKTGGAAAVIPAGAAVLWWSAKSTVDFIDERRAEDEPTAHLGEVLVRAAEHDQAEPQPAPAPQPLRPHVYVLDEGHQYFGPAIEGEVVR